jgi:hypothetical protein
MADAQHLLLASEAQAQALARSPALLAAAPEQLLAALQQRAREAGVSEVRALDAAAAGGRELRQLEACVLGLLGGEG